MQMPGPSSRSSTPIVDETSANRIELLQSFDAFEASPLPCWVVDIEEECIVLANAAACGFWRESTKAALLGRDLSNDLSPALLDRLEFYRSEFMAHKIPLRDVWTVYPGGCATSGSMTFQGYALPDERIGILCRVDGVLGPMGNDQKLAQALLNSDTIIAVFDISGTARALNPAAKRAFGGEAPKLAELFLNASDYTSLMFELDRSGAHRMIACVTQDDQNRWLDISAKTCTTSVMGTAAIMITALDVTDLKTSRDQARYFAERDQLTGCFNRGYIKRIFAEMDPAVTRRDPHFLLYFDVDRFKQVNDTFGHDSGDILLKSLAHRAQKAVGDGGTVARIGGDEFVILLRCASGPHAAETKIASIFQKLTGVVTNGAATIPFFVSMGVAPVTPDDTDFERVLHQADIALYRSKQNGRGKYTLYDHQMGQKADAKNRFETEIKTALRHREFTLHLQPRKDLKEDRIVSAEGLVRWTHPTRGVVLPGEFIPICEQTGMIEPLGQQVLQMGFEQIQRWHNAGHATGISLNISPRQFAEESLMDTLTEAALTADFPTEKVELEITETVLIGDVDEIADKLQTIADLGFRIAIDDFGTGYSNLSYISRFPLSCLKIDRSFVHQLPKSGPIVRLILALSKQIGATIVAEGVETRAQYDWLAENGCDQVQGYFISRPAPAGLLEKLGLIH